MTNESAAKLRFSSPDWFSQHIPNWKVWFAPYKDRVGTQIVEIGAYEGRSSMWLLDNILTEAGSMLISIDPFDDQGMQDCAIDKPGEVVFENFKHNVLNRYKNVLHCRLRSEEALRRMFSTRVSAVYIDGSHKAKDVLSDAVLAWPMLLPNGLMVFDDYLWSGSDHSQLPRVGIEAFLSAMHGEYMILHKGVQVAIKKT